MSHAMMLDQIASKIRTNMPLETEELDMLDNVNNNFVKIHVHFKPEQVFGYKYIYLDPTRPSIIEGFDPEIEELIAHSSHRGGQEVNEEPEFIRIFNHEKGRELLDDYNQGIALTAGAEAQEANLERYKQAQDIEFNKGSITYAAPEPTAEDTPEAGFEPEVPAEMLNVEEMVPEGISLSDLPE